MEQVEVHIDNKVYEHQYQMIVQSDQLLLEDVFQTKTVANFNQEMLQPPFIN